MIRKKLLAAHPLPAVPKIKKDSKAVTIETTTMQGEKIIILNYFESSNNKKQYMRTFITKDDYLTQDLIDTSNWYKGCLWRLGCYIGHVSISSMESDMILDTLQEWGFEINHDKYFYKETALWNISCHQERIMKKRREEKHRHEVEKVDRELKVFKKETKGIEHFLDKTVFKRSSFLFYNKKANTGYCTWCEKDVSLSDIKDKFRHNSEGVCPSCKNKVTFKSDGISRGQLLIRGTGVVFQKSGKDLLIRYYDIDKDYRKDYRNPTVEKLEVVRTIIRDKKCTNYEWGNFHNTGKWRFRLCTGSTDVKYTASHIYEVYNINCLKNTDYEDMLVKEFNEIHAGAFSCEVYLEKYFRDPIIEKLMKVGFINITEAVMRHRLYNISLNREKSELHKILNLTKDKFRILAQMKNPTAKQLIAVCNNKTKKQYSLEEYKFIGDSCFAYRSQIYERFKTGSFNKFHKYMLERLDQRGEAPCYLYFDYLEMCKKLGYDMKSSFVIYPKDLQKAHDEADSIITYQKNKKEYDAIKSRLKELHEMYDFSYKNIIITPPIKSATEVAYEGKTLHHCVGSYIGKFAKGETTILFVRQKKSLSTPFYTLEVKNNEVVQCRGKYNASMTKEVEEAVEAFKKEKLKKAVAV